MFDHSYLIMLPNRESVVYYLCYLLVVLPFQLVTTFGYLCATIANLSYCLVGSQSFTIGYLLVVLPFQLVTTLDTYA